MLAHFGGCFDERTRELLDELVENNEHGVAFEMVAGTLAQGDEPISEEDLAYRGLGRSWESARDPIPWAKLEARVA